MSITAPVDVSDESDSTTKSFNKSNGSETNNKIHRVGSVRKNLSNILERRLSIAIPHNIILVIDRDLSEDELKKLAKFYKVYVITEEDYGKLIFDLPKVEIYILRMKNELEYKRCRGLSFYCRNMTSLAKFKKIYYRQTQLIKDTDIDRLHFDHIIHELPPDTATTFDFTTMLFNNNDIQINTPCCIFFSCCLSDITLRDFCGYLLSGALAS